MDRHVEGHGKAGKRHHKSNSGMLFGIQHCRTTTSTCFAASHHPTAGISPARLRKEDGGWMGEPPYRKSALTHIQAPPNRAPAAGV